VDRKRNAENGLPASVSFTIKIPNKPGIQMLRHRNYVSPGTTSVVIETSSAGYDNSSSTLNCSSGQTCTIDLTVTPGVVTFVVSLFDGINGTGDLLSTGSTMQTISADTANVVSVTASGIVVSASIVASPSIEPAGTPTTILVSVNALDADGYTIVGGGQYLNTAQQPISFSIGRADTTANGSGSTSLPVSTISAPAGNPLSLTYNGQAIYSTALSLSANVPITGTLAGTNVVFVPTVVNSYPITTYSQPTDITVGPDRALWFTEYDADMIGRITTSGQLTQYALTPGSQPNGITLGPDGNLWFTELNSQKIASITPAGVITEYALLSPFCRPEFITTGPDGNLWFTDPGSNAVGRITPEGLSIEFPITTTNSSPFGITVGSDANLWFTEMAGGKLAKITTAGIITEYPVAATVTGSSARRLNSIQRHYYVSPLSLSGVSSSNGTVSAVLGLASASAATNGPTYITLGPDGALWFTFQNYEAGRISTSGTISYFPISNVAQPAGITTGKDGNLWFDDDEDLNNTGAIGRLQPNGTVNEYEYPEPTAPYAFGIISGADGNLYFTDAGASIIGQLVY